MADYKDYYDFSELAPPNSSKDKWQYAYSDDWTAVYKNGKIHWQHHSPEWQEVFSWLGFNYPEYLGEFDWSELGAAPDTVEELHIISDKERERLKRIAELEAELRRLKNG